MERLLVAQTWPQVVKPSATDGLLEAEGKGSVPSERPRRE